MPVVRLVLLVLLIACGVCFALFAFTGEARYKRIGLVTLKWTLIAAVAFFVALFLEREYG
ncbi:hypothetical protein WG902_11270 [Ramlibacter sp. PS3R-8]|uniref:hypothetical protein n=1 Tax=Ramlibacter sp. PS3R-8 TaxID=3133437 RepID=UPI0030B44DAD